MNDLWLGLASFVHYVKQNDNLFSFEKRGDNSLYFWQDRKQYPTLFHVFEIELDSERVECGWVYTNNEDLTLISNKKERINFIKYHCSRYGPAITTKSHCNLEKSEWGKISIVLNELSGYVTECSRPPASNT